MAIPSHEYGKGAKDSELKGMGLERARSLSKGEKNELAALRKRDMAKKIGKTSDTPATPHMGTPKGN